MKFSSVLLSFCLFVCLLPLSAQEIVKGNILDEDKMPIDYFNIEILNPKDTTLIRGGSFIDGYFEIKNLSQGDYLLRVSSIGYEAKYINLNGGNINLNDISLRLKPYELEEVTVNAIPPRIIMKEDKFIINIENTYISDAGNISNALQRVPFVMVNKMSGEISVAGRGATLILIDGKRLKDNHELQLINSNQIKKIEIIENPSAKYEAEGHAVINIITKKELRKGLSGSLYSVYLLGRHSSGQMTGDLTLNTEKLTVYGRYGFTRSITEGYNSTRELFQKKDQFFDAFSRDVKNKISENRNNYSVGIDYRINPQNTIGVQVDGYVVDGGDHKITLSDKQKNDVFYPTEFMVKKGDSSPWRHTVNLNYSYQGKKFQFSTMGDYTKARTNQRDDIHETDTINFNRFMKNLNVADYDLYSVKIDMRLPIAKINSKFEFGGKISSVRNKSTSDFLRNSSEEWIIDSAFSSKIDFSEQVLAGYVLLSGKLTKTLQYSAGLRYEYLWNKNEWQGERDSLRKMNLDDFFPSATLLYRPSKIWVMRLGYTRRISRPNYAILNNKLLYINSYSTRSGNPYLEPTIYNSISYSVGRKTLVATFTASYIENPAEYVYINDPVNIENYTILRDNIENRWQLSANLSGSFKYKIWNFQPFFSFSYMPRSLIEDGIKYTTYYPGINARLNNQLQLAKTLSFDFNVVYDRSAYSVKEFNDQVNLDFSLRKKMMKNKLTLQATYHHEVYKWNQYLAYGYKVIDFWWDGDSRNQLMVSLQYTFSTAKKKYNQKSGIKEELNRL